VTARSAGASGATPGPRKPKRQAALKAEAELPHGPCVTNRALHVRKPTARMTCCSAPSPNGDVAESDRSGPPEGNWIRRDISCVPEIHRTGAYKRARSKLHHDVIAEIKPRKWSATELEPSRQRRLDPSQRA